MRIRSRTLCPSLALALALALAPAARAGDGVVEINQTCAEQTGCFSGDAAGYPVTIDGSAGRSYRLTSDLTAPNANVDGIVVSTFDVSLDLAGFRIRRLGCADVLAPCTPTSGSGSAIKVSDFRNRGLSVRNGSVIGMGSYGVYGGTEAVITDVRAHWNRLDGIFVDPGAVVAGCSSHGNGSAGIVAGQGSTIVDNSATGNGGRGISAGGGSTVSRNSAGDNGDGGIGVGAGSTVSGNATVSNTGDGITTQEGSLIHGNTVRSNTGYGVRLDTDAGFRENVISSNVLGAVNGAGAVNLGNNACNGSTTCILALP